MVRRCLTNFQNLIRKNWDDILRFMVTIKLKETTASQVFKRLSSYDKNHSLYKAIKEFGRIIKNGSMLTWQHVNMRGEYDFTSAASNGSPFDMTKILALKVS